MSSCAPLAAESKPADPSNVSDEAFYVLIHPAVEKACSNCLQWPARLKKARKRPLLDAKNAK